MSRVGNALNMLILLKSRRKMKISEIATELGVSEREVRRYKDDLEQARIYITSIKGKDGGYMYEGKDYLLGLNLSDEEYSTLITVKKHLKSSGFIMYKDFKLIVDKLIAIKEKTSLQEIHSEYFIKNIRPNYDYEKERQIWLDINAAIITRNKIKIKYHSLNTGEKERIVRPYVIFQYRNSMYFVGFCELRKDIRDFKMSRIKSYEILEEKFPEDDNFDSRNYMANCFGIFKDEEINLKLKIKYPMAQIIKEKIWVENQHIVEITDENSILFEATMKGKTEIKSWILSMGSSVEVIKPIDLKKEIKEELEKMIKLYK
ncbi:HTH domain protein [Clostridium tepidiprofundi DSM 19306]|uniref:HTH domain protein n=1 Tax=Clostridium tepidiprofundi DSM 19306 TaxID=1121338 RepID=A0A151B2E5_9CLOT|nr:transcriptional regulator [Clostridium tepidiprofundi]KYH34089.1 HTH domain protein [Clostridium tepidiprofundi DSM 19306]